MKKMTVISSDNELNDRVTRICEKFNNYFIPNFFASKDESVDFLKYDLPEVNLLNYSDRRIDHTEIIETIKNDPWLHYGGLIIVHKGSQQKEVMELTQSLNMIATIPRATFVKDFFRLMKILIQNRQILFQRDLQKNLMKHISGSFVMDNDPFNVGTYSNIIPNYLYNIGYINPELKDQLHVALFELLMNSVEHGNCNISHAEKTAWLEEHGDILDLIRKKNQDPKVRKRRVYFSYTLSPESSRYTIRDEGKGFDWRKRLMTKTDTLSPPRPGYSYDPVLHQEYEIQ